ncbi:MAG TPA: ATP-grasp domain-containing protein, partial [Planctomycetaceae bacterium]
MPRPAGPPDMLISGASARAAAVSAARAGLRVAAADLFADRDLAAVADVAVIEDWPTGIEAWAGRFPASVPFVYVGGMENEPELLDRVAATRPVLGNVGEPLRRVRTPETLAELLLTAGLPYPKIDDVLDVGGADPLRRRLVKPRRSAAGRGIRWWRGLGDSLAEGEYLQEFVEGQPGSAAYLACGDDVELLGVTEQLLPDGPPLADAAPFTYVGSITAEGVGTEPLRELGRRLAEAGLRGPFGVDFVWGGPAGTPRFVPIEVNPRYTAGMEVLELRSGRSFLAEHLRAFATVSRPKWLSTKEDERCFGKRIVYAPRPLRVGDLPVPSVEEILAGGPLLAIADIPAEDTFVPAGAPVCTVLAVGGSRCECL